MNQIRPTSLSSAPSCLSSSGANISVAEFGNAGPQKLHDDDLENGRSTKLTHTGDNIEKSTTSLSCCGLIDSFWSTVNVYLDRWKCPLNIMKLAFSLIMHLWDLWSDVIITITYIQDNNVVWFLLSTIIIVLSQFHAAHHAYTFESKSGNPHSRRVLFGLLGFLNLHIFWDFWFLAIKHKGNLDHPVALKNRRFFEETRFLESMLEALPQVLLQLYVFLSTSMASEWSGAQQALAIMSICTSLFTVSLGLYQCIPSRVGALRWWNKVALFLSTFVGTVSRTLFWVLLAHEIHSAVFGAAAAMWACCVLIRATGKKLPMDRSRFFFMLLHAAQDVLVVSSLTMAKSLLSVKQTQETVVVLSQGVGQIVFGVWFCLSASWENSVGLVLGWVLVGAACVNVVLGLYQLYLISKVLDASTQWLDTMKDGQCEDEPVPGEVDVDFVGAGGDETFLMLAAQKGHVKMLRNLLLRDADVLACCRDGFTALKKSVNVECSRTLLGFMLANYPIAHLADKNMLVWQISRSSLEDEQKQELASSVIELMSSELTRQLHDFQINTLDICRKYFADVLAGNGIRDDWTRALGEALKLDTWQITTVDISDNKIGSGGARILSQAFKLHTCHVTTLNISENGIGDEGARALADAVKSDTCKITTLNIWRNGIGSDGARALAEAFMLETCNVTTLRIHGNWIRSEGARAVAEAVKLPTCKITTLDISGNQIGDDGAKALAEAVSLDTCKITNMSSSNNCIRFDGGRALAEAVKLDTCRITTLHIDGNSMECDGARAFANAVKLATCKITTLDISYNGIQDDGARALAEAVKLATCNMTTLKICGNVIGSEGARALAEAVKLDTCKITFLDISCNGIGSDGASSLGEAVKAASCKIKTLTISGRPSTYIQSSAWADPRGFSRFMADNGIGDAVVRALAEAVKLPTCNITTLDISNHEIGDAGARALSEAVRLDTCKITTLHIHGSVIGYDGAKAFAEALKLGVCNITNLDISYNGVRSNGARALSEAVKLPTCKITNLNISNNRIGTDGARALAEAVRLDTCKIITLNISYNAIGDDGARALADAVKLPTCKITTLFAFGIGIGDDGKKALGEAARRHVWIDF